MIAEADLTDSEVRQLRRKILAGARVHRGQATPPQELTPEIIREREEADRLLQEAQTGQEPKGVA